MMSLVLQVFSSRDWRSILQQQQRNANDAEARQNHFQHKQQETEEKLRQLGRMRVAEVRNRETEWRKLRMKQPYHDDFDDTADAVMTSQRAEQLARREELEHMSERSKDVLVKQEIAEIRKVCSPSAFLLLDL